jgi:hypothetical protein
MTAGADVNTPQTTAAATSEDEIAFTTFAVIRVLVLIMASSHLKKGINFWSIW